MITFAIYSKTSPGDYSFLFPHEHSLNIAELVHAMCFLRQHDGDRYQHQIQRRRWRHTGREAASTRNGQQETGNALGGSHAEGMQTQ